MGIRNWVEDKIFWAKTGIKIETANDGKPVKQVVIRYKDFFFEIWFDTRTGEPTGDFAWTQGSPITNIPIRDFYTAKKEG